MILFYVLHIQLLLWQPVYSSPTFVKPALSQPVTLQRRGPTDWFVKKRQAWVDYFVKLQSKPPPPTGDPYAWMDERLKGKEVITPSEETFGRMLQSFGHSVVIAEMQGVAGGIAMDTVKVTKTYKEAVQRLSALIESIKATRNYQDLVAVLSRYKIQIGEFFRRYWTLFKQKILDWIPRRAHVHFGPHSVLPVHSRPEETAFFGSLFAFFMEYYKQAMYAWKIPQELNEYSTYSHKWHIVHHKLEQAKRTQNKPAPMMRSVDDYLKQANAQAGQRKFKEADEILNLAEQMLS